MSPGHKENSVSPGTSEQRSNKQESAREETSWSRLHSLLASSKLALILLIVIGCVSLVGMFILQNAPQEEYLLRYGEPWGNFIRNAGLGNVYSAWWYLLLILLIALNLIFCTLKRIKPSFKQAFSRPSAQDNEILRNARRISVSVVPVTLWKSAETILRKRGFVVSSVDAGLVKLIAAQKGSLSRVGFIVTHVAVLLVLISGIINGRLAFRHQEPLSIGESFDVSKVEPSADFRIRADDFAIETGEQGRVRDYKSKLTVIENGKEVLTKVVRVNHPLVYKGIGFYQASYGEESDRIKEARIYLLDDGTFSAAIGETRDVPGTDLQIRVTDYVPYFVKDLVTGEVRSRSPEPKLPAIRLDVMRQGKVVDSGWLIMGMEVHSSSGELARFHFADYYPLLYTGIDIIRNPGAPLMFAGFGVATAGLLFSFLVSFKRIWVRVFEDRPGHSELSIAGVASRYPLALKREIEGLYQSLGGVR
jgi:cytochrome c biogenesis protein